ncbi:hypothetical protein QLL95_gp1231 [Cotonvirus japonicus]|uniref:Uncharacterized protein n=1 Tax=Cotonvirus japonicus TaxID=2811091 RepID=A0ABM7NRV3_9VIRU|nr:hypothetical protein QLL95_gp1231 [Cotonvirus japonicus]BCS82892.1 hypothetical protein [Cotonvirus japonicus]
MCWSQEVSLITFVIIIGGCIYLYKRNRPNDRWIAIFAGIVAMIQLAEFFMWSDLNCGRINRYASIFALFILVLEPLTNIISGLLFSDNSNKILLKLLLVTYIFFVVVIFFKQQNQSIMWCGTSPCGSHSAIDGFFIKKSCNLKWIFMDSFGICTSIIWVLFLLVPFLAMKPKSQGIFFVIVGILTLIMAMSANNAARGSLWCWLAIFLIFFKILW